MKFNNRKVLNFEEKMEVAIDFLERMDFFGLEPDLLLNTEAFDKTINTAKDAFEVMRDIPANLLKIDKEIKLSNPENMTIMQIAIADAQDKTVGEFLKEVSDRYTKAGFMDVKISEILCDDADEMLTVSMTEDPQMVSCTFQNESFEGIKKFYEKLTDEPEEKEAKVKCEYKDGTEGLTFSLGELSEVLESLIKPETRNAYEAKMKDLLKELKKK
ncbi:MAG: hypothetical protein ACRCZ9_11340 [Fusobacteriaceae bacterium]